MWFDVDDRGPIRWLILNRPERKNAIPFDGWAPLGEAFVDFEASPSRVLVLTGAGGEFCAGADLGGSIAPTGPGDVHRRMKMVADVATVLHRLTKPVIAAVDGVAVGAGLNLALGCDVVVATSRARFSEIFVRRGLAVDSGGTWLLPRLVGLQRAKEMALSGRMIGAEEALRIGLVTDVVAPGDLVSAVGRTADGFLAGAPVAQMFIKQGIDHAWDVSFEEALSWEGQSQTICFATDDVAEGISAFLEKRLPSFRGR
jgi:2-(1,2-epoxy-1,2-dihydrophenyl)acetyl-CoA isomerase